jgi:hypothetical protein
MNVSQMNQILAGGGDASLHFMLPSGEFVPSHFHVTEVGRVQKSFIDCGGTRRDAASCVLQLWTAHDVDHRLVARRFSARTTCPLRSSTDRKSPRITGSRTSSRRRRGSFSSWRRSKPNALQPTDAASAGPAAADGVT